jgi:hypothetical protein
MAPSPRAALDVFNLQSSIFISPRWNVGGFAEFCTMPPANDAGGQARWQTFRERRHDLVGHTRDDDPLAFIRAAIAAGGDGLRRHGERRPLRSEVARAKNSVSVVPGQSAVAVTPVPSTTDNAYENE